MGTRGPKKQPTEIKERAGTLKKSRDGAAPVAVDYHVPPCPFPNDDTPEAQSWHLLMQVMRESQLDAILTRADTGTLEAAAISWCRARQASAVVAALPIDGRYVHTKSNGLRPHPAIAEERAAWSDFRRFAADLGLSPSARASLGSAAAPATGGGGAEGGDLETLTSALLSAQPAPLYAVGEE